MLKYKQIQLLLQQRQEETLLTYSTTIFCRNMDKLESLVPQGISINCLEDFGCLKVKDLKKILAAYKEKVSGGKADLVLRVYAIFSRVTSHYAAISDVSTSSVDDTLVNSFTYDAIFRRESDLFLPGFVVV